MCGVMCMRYFQIYYIVKITIHIVNKAKDVRFLSFQKNLKILFVSLFCAMAHYIRIRSLYQFSVGE